MGTARPDPAAAAMAAHVVVLLDRSGSMIDGVDGYISGFNAFVDAQRAAGARVSLYLFDERAERVLDCVPAADVPPLTRATYRLGGSTALYDAIGAALALALGGPPGVCAVLTDGQDNASRTHTRGGGGLDVRLPRREPGRVRRRQRAGRGGPVQRL